MSDLLHLITRSALDSFILLFYRSVLSLGSVSGRLLLPPQHYASFQQINPEPPALPASTANRRSNDDVVMLRRSSGCLYNASLIMATQPLPVVSSLSRRRGCRGRKTCHQTTSVPSTLANLSHSDSCALCLGSLRLTKRSHRRPEFVN